MNSAYVLAPASAVLVAWVAFRFALQQDARRWSRERRAEVYVDALVEASAEMDSMRGELAVRQGVDPADLGRFPDDHLPSLERKRLGARLLVFASRDVIREHNRFSGTLGRASMPPYDEATTQAHKVHVEVAFTDLERVIREELDAERASSAWRRLSRWAHGRR
jgi:hypothetical protein